MKKRLISIIIFIAYCAILVKVMVFKDIPVIRVGHLMLNFGGVDTGHAPNFVPFRTIVPYLFGFKGLIIAGVNLVGNVLLLVPIGFLLPFVFQNFTWKKSILFGMVTGFIIELMQVMLHVGIFDIDDVILNALGVIIGFAVCVILTMWMRERKYMHIFFSAILAVTLAGVALYFIYPWGQPIVDPRAGVESEKTDNFLQSSDLCGGTRGNGQIVSIENGKFTIKKNDGTNQIINLTDGATIKTPAGTGSLSDLKIGDRITLVGGPNSDGSFTAEAVFVCNR